MYFNSCLCVVAGVCVLTCMHVCVCYYRCVEPCQCYLMNLSSNNIIGLDALDSSKALYVTVAKNVIVVALCISINYINGTLVHTFSKHQVPWSTPFQTSGTWAIPSRTPGTLVHTFSKHQVPWSTPSPNTRGRMNKQSCREKCPHKHAQSGFHAEFQMEKKTCEVRICVYLRTLDPMHMHCWKSVYMATL